MVDLGTLFDKLLLDERLHGAAVAHRVHHSMAVLLHSNDAVLLDVAVHALGRLVRPPCPARLCNGN